MEMNLAQWLPSGNSHPRWSTHVCMCAYTQAHTCMYMHLHTSEHTQTGAHTQRHAHTCMHAHIYTHAFRTKHRLRRNQEIHVKNPASLILRPMLSSASRGFQTQMSPGAWQVSSVVAGAWMESSRGWGKLWLRVCLPRHHLWHRTARTLSTLNVNLAFQLAMKVYWSRQKNRTVSLAVCWLALQS